MYSRIMNITTLKLSEPCPRFNWRGIGYTKCVMKIFLIQSIQPLKRSMKWKGNLFIFIFIFFWSEPYDWINSIKRAPKSWFNAVSLFLLYSILYLLNCPVSFSKLSKCIPTISIIPNLQVLPCTIVLEIIVNLKCLVEWVMVIIFLIQVILLLKLHLLVPVWIIIIISK